MDRSASPWRVLDDTAPALTGAPESDARGVANGADTPADGQTDPGAVGGIPVRLVAALALAAVLGVAAFAVAASGSSGGSVEVENGGASIARSARPSLEAPAASGGDLVIDVQGAVLRPGVLHLVGGSRVADAIAAAGGYGPRVDAERAGRELNLAAELRDGDRVLVPSRDDPPTTGTGTGSTGSTGGAGGTGGSTGAGTGPKALIDLNHATASELDTLPGVGPATAEKIIARREEQPFATIEALRDRKVVGAATFEKLKTLVTVTPG